MARITRLTDTERKAGRNDKYDFLNSESEWFMQTIIDRKPTINMDIVEGVKIECQSRCSSDVEEENAPSIIHLKDICTVMDWEFPRDKEDRNRLAKFSNFLQTVQGANAQQMLWNGMLAVLTRDDILEPTDMFLSKKEARKARKRKRLEELAAAGLSTPEARAAAKREKGRLRRKSKKLEITIEEVIAQEKIEAEAKVQEQEAKRIEAESKKAIPKKAATARKSSGAKKPKSPKRSSSKKAIPAKKPRSPKK